jgi:hypothetical protein
MKKLNGKYCIDHILPVHMCVRAVGNQVVLEGEGARS